MEISFRFSSRLMDFIKALIFQLTSLCVSHSFECAVGQVSTLLRTTLQTYFTLMNKVRAVSHTRFQLVNTQAYTLYFTSHKELPHNCSYCLSHFYVSPVSPQRLSLKTRIMYVSVMLSKLM